MKRTAMQWITSGAAALGVALAALGAAAQDFPNKPIKLVVGFPPGGSNDQVARIIAPEMAKALGQPVVIENKPGANATLGTDFVAKSAPDGYTLTLGSLSPLVIALATYSKIPYDTARDFEPVNTVALTPEMIAVHPSVPVKTLPELVAYSKKNPVTLSSAGNGGLPHLAIELLRNVSQGDFLHVPYKGAGPAVTDTIGGHVNGIVMDISALTAQVKDGKLRALAVTNRARSVVAPDVPTTGEQGLPAMQAVNWFAIMAPKGTPAPIVLRINAALAKAVNSAAVQEEFRKIGIEPFLQPNPDRFRQFLAEEIARWGKIARDAGAKAD